MFSEYGQISSELYEFTKPVGTSLGGDLEYYWNLLKDIDGHILEAGVGTGRLLIPYIQKGLKVDGVDLSQDMLDICRYNCDKANISADLYLQDLQNLNIDKRYDAIIMPTGSFCLLPNREAVINTLKSFKRHLSENGKIIVDIGMPINFKEGERHTNICKLSDRVGIIYTIESLKMDWKEQRTCYINRYEKWEDNQLIKTEVSEFNLNWYGVEEFKLILESVGYKNINYIWDYGTSGDGEIATFEAYI